MESNYQVAFSYYKLKQYEKAVSLFQSSLQKRYIAQTSYYHMADAYLKLDEKDYAEILFMKQAN